ncbi:retinol dehydrogenase 11-like isoform X2 [Ostrea edulis]|uniref:retinol dehydrogenase 11-like isoform X2 n=1 Tax=Ostrea edulis TaxID=37623 RepID=UPI0024AFFA32|nr:retinol dehydrogenase 11-like isoform X2 [Ostrea edulis]
MELCIISVACCLFVVILAAVKLYELSIKRPFVSNVKLDGKTVIVTGANTGLGFWTALDLASRGARVILACRNLQKAEDARKKILKELQSNCDVIVRHLDLSSMKSVRQFVRETFEQESRLDILINNAAVSDLLKNSAPSRIVNLTSVMNTFGHLNCDDLQAKGHYDPFSAYKNTKLMNVLFTKELARRLEGTGVTTSCVHPGLAATDIFRSLRIANIVGPLISLFFKTAKDGAQTTIYCALSEEMQDAKGEYMSDSQVYDKTVWINKDAYDEGLCKKLWETTEAILESIES